MSGKKRVLIADDDDGLRQYWQLQFENAPYDVVFASDGYEAVLAYRDSLAEGRPFDLIVLDYYMPVYLGVVVASMIRSNDDATPIFLLTASNDDTLLPRSRVAGIRQIWLKPEASTFLRFFISEKLTCHDPDARSPDQGGLRRTDQPVEGMSAEYAETMRALLRDTSRRANRIAQA